MFLMCKKDKRKSEVVQCNYQVALARLREL